MALSNLNKDTTTRLFKMITSEDKISEDKIKKIKNDSNTYSQLNLIYRQIENLKLEALNILENHNKTEEINNIICNFNKVPGTLYYLYSNDSNDSNGSNGIKILSLVPPEYDHDNNITNLIYDNFLGKFYYDYDMKFKEII